MLNQPFKLKSAFEPRGDQPAAIKGLVAGVKANEKHQTLLGVTGSGKTFTIANVIQAVQKPTLILAPNKTLAAQLYAEFKDLFPENAVEYFVSYYDYYQPEAYVPARDLFIEKDSAINEEIDKLRHAATRSLLERNDVIIVASVSCIYGLGSPEAYHGLLVAVNVGQEIARDNMLTDLAKIQYERNDYDFHRGTFRVRGDTVEIFPAHEDERAIRIEFFGDEVEAIYEMDPLRGVRLNQLDKVAIYPATHFVTWEKQREKAVDLIEKELELRLKELTSLGKSVEAYRLEQRTRYDLELLQEIGFCKGIENYSRHLTGRNEGDAPPTLFDYFGDDWLLVADESHVSIPQVGAMYKGDRARKQNLVEYGFRLPSAMDNRPLRFEEFEDKVHQCIYVSATPAAYELEKSIGVIVEQLIRPTGLIDPKIEVRPVETQVDDLLEEIRLRVELNERVLVTTLTKRMAEDLTQYYEELGIRVRYLHSDIDTLERVEILRDLRLGEFDVLVGINLLREGLDLPEVSLVGILDADKEGFLRSERSLIQTVGRAARHLNGTVLMYADKITNSMDKAISETNRRRDIQTAYNKKHKITPQSVKRNIEGSMQAPEEADYVNIDIPDSKKTAKLAVADIPKEIERLTKEMKTLAKEMDFEKAAELRDQIKSLKQLELKLGVSI